jgi:uncharacterized Zn finger protein (UPF0148 family)
MGNPVCPYCGHELTRSEIAALMGSASSEAKTEAARRNIRKRWDAVKKEKKKLRGGT